VNGRLAAGTRLHGTHFEIEEEATGNGRRTLRLRGELDMASAPELRRRFSTAMRDGDDGITLDLHGLEFIDSTGINAILLMREVCMERRRDLSIVRASPKVSSVFELVGLADLLDAPAAAE